MYGVGIEFDLYWGSNTALGWVVMEQVLINLLTTIFILLYFMQVLFSGSAFWKGGGAYDWNNNSIAIDLDDSCRSEK